MAAERGESEEPVGHGRANAKRAAVIAVIMTWIAATIFGLGVAATTRIGPMVLTISSHHGVHVGDLLAFAVAYAAALAVTIRMLPARAW